MRVKLSWSPNEWSGEAAPEEEWEEEERERESSQESLRAAIIKDCFYGSCSYES